MWLYRTNRREACFNMASDNTRKLMLAKVLNSAHAANILDENDSIASEVWLLIILQHFLLLKERMSLMERMKAIKRTLKWGVRAEETWKPRTEIQKKTAILNQAVGVLAIQKTPYLTMKASLTTVSQIETDIQDNMTELWHRVAESSKLSVQVQTQSTSSWDVNSSTLRKTWMHSTVFHGWNLGQETKHGRI